MSAPSPPVLRASSTRAPPATSQPPPVLRASRTARAALTLLLAACDPEPQPLPLAPAPYNPPRSVYAPDPAFLPDLPNLDASICPFPDRPAHRLVLNNAGVVLDDVPITDPTTLPAALADLGELSLLIDPDLPYAKIRPHLAALPPNLRLWIGVRVHRSTEIRHLSIAPPQFGVRPPRTTPLPPRTYAIHLTSQPQDSPPIDPLAPQIVPGELTGVFVSATPGVLWSRIAADLARACDGATLIDPSTDPPYHDGVKLPKSVTAPKPKINGQVHPQALDRLLHIHLGNPARFCFHRMLTLTPRARGRVDLTLTIDSFGLVYAVKIDRSTLPDPDVATCLANHALRWTFPRPTHGPITVQIPLVL